MGPKLTTLRRRVARLLFERGTLEDTYGDVDLTQFGLNHPDRIAYAPSAWRHLGRALGDRQIGRSDVFLDYGCGKGRVVYQAALLPFGRVIGVEISPELIDVSRRNVERNRQKLACQDVQLVCTDAAAYRVPDDVTYVYMYNPFVGDVFRAVLAELLESLDRRPRRMRLIYVYPAMAAEVERTGRFSRIYDSEGHRHEKIVVYESGVRGMP